MQYDVFISHASEDKDSFVRDLAKRLAENQVLVWYDEFTLKPGSSLRRSIDIGLSKSRFGVIVLSENFLNKRWTNWELDGLVARQNSFENEMIIPIWLNITKDKVLEYSPPLADKVAINADIGLEGVLSQLLRVVKPEGSTLVVARQLLFENGLNPPVVTDDWWLDVVEYCGKEYLHHEYLSFSIKWKSWEPKDRGEYIGLHALQKLWQQAAEEKSLSQLSHPDEVLKFIEKQPGLKQVCQEQPNMAAFYFPQLAIHSFGGFLESSFEALLHIPEKYSRQACTEEVALRHPTFGNYEPSHLASFYFTGAGGGLGPSTQHHELIDCLIWLLSKKSMWLTARIRSVLLGGIIAWGVWPWTSAGSYVNDFEANDFTGEFQNALFLAIDENDFVLTPLVENDIKSRLSYTIVSLQLPETLDQLYQLFLEQRLIESWISWRTKRQNRSKANN